VKKFGLHIVGALLLSSIPMHTAVAYKKRKLYECYSDKKVLQSSKRNPKQLSFEYSAKVSDIEGPMAIFVAKKYQTKSNKVVKTTILTQGEAHFDDSRKYIVVQATEWALAIAPEKKRASLYSSNPDINEIPMFCLSESLN